MISRKVDFVYIQTWHLLRKISSESLSKGGVGSSIVERGKGIVGSASLSSMATQAAVLGVFTAMSIATGQFFLTQIN